MVVLWIVLLVLWLIVAMLGFAITSLLWIGVVLFVATAVIGAVRRRPRRR
jgi:hypothetical protein